jgi:hypothetical protein
MVAPNQAMKNQRSGGLLHGANRSRIIDSYSIRCGLIAVNN